MRGIHWFRNDLRLRDNTALDALARQVDAWLAVFVFDPEISSVRAGGPRMRFLLDCLTRLSADLDKRGIPLIIRHGKPHSVLPKLVRDVGAGFLSFNEGTTPFAKHRDRKVKQKLLRIGCEPLERLDHVVFRSLEIRRKSGGAYSVYSAYRNTWWDRWHDAPRLPIRQTRLPGAIPGHGPDRIPDPKELGIEVDACRIPTGGERAATRRLDRFLHTAVGRYAVDRDRPDVDGTSRLSPYLRFGAISVRQCFHSALEAARLEPLLKRGAEKWLDELVWREFYSAVLEENPRVLRENHRKEFDAVVWNDDANAFEAWCEGRTGFPIVDAGMRQLLATGWMHNRVRMIVASFLTKDLLIDWRKGERFFFERLVDGDPASNNGGWQWAASTGTDAQPYFRIFNPTTQGKRWDPEGRYVRRWVPELRGLPLRETHTPGQSGLERGYPLPIIDHAERRGIALARFRRARQIAVAS
jgi:deoxyribodipyrimidine photo-lyase